MSFEGVKLSSTRFQPWRSFAIRSLSPGQCLNDTLVSIMAAWKNVSFMCLSSPPDAGTSHPAVRLLMPACHEALSFAVPASNLQRPGDRCHPQSRGSETKFKVAKDSRGEGALNLLEELLDHRVVTDIKYLAAAWLDQQTNPIN